MDDHDVEELHRLWELKEKGAISEDEYARLKIKILGQETGSASPTPEPPSDRPIAGTDVEFRNKHAGIGGRQVGIGCAVVAVLVLILAAIGSSGSNSPASNAMNVDENLTATDMNATAVTSSQNSEEASSSWSYSQDEDKVRGGTTYYARTTSMNSIAQSFPYDSDTTMDLAVRKSPAYGTDVILTISSGQMMCPSYEGCSGTVRFDNGPAQHISFNGPADGSSDTVFVAGAKEFIAKLKKAKKLTIEKTLYEAGNPQFEFNVAGLKWNH